jgi:DNA-binding transcriptional ArsR family regulator
MKIGASSGGGGGGDVREDPVYRVKADLFRTLGHPARLRLLELLGAGERTVGELQAELDLDSSGVSQHLSVLRRLGLLESRKLATSVHCRLRDPRTLELLVLAREIVAARLRDEGRLLDGFDSGTEERPEGPSRVRVAATVSEAHDQ